MGIEPCGVEKTALLRFRRICEDPPPIKKGRSTSGNRHNAAKRRPNPTRNAKNLAHNFHSFIRLLAVVINFLPGWTANMRKENIKRQSSPFRKFAKIL
jgi:hypothetical protein